MVFEAVKWGEAFGIGANAVAFDPAAAVPAPRYDLAKAIYIVRSIETSTTRGAVFAEIKSKNRLYSLVDSAYSRCGAKLVQPLVLLAYMLKCICSLGPCGDDVDEAVAIANFDNERHTIDRLTALVPRARIHRLSPKRSHIVEPGQLRAALHLLKAAPRIWRFLSRLARLHSFMPAARIASGLAYYIRFSLLFAERPRLGAAIVASNYSPEALGLAAAAHRSGRRVIYINHAPVPANGAMVPPVLADCAVFYGDAIRRTYESRSRCTADVALIGQPGIARPMEWREEVGQVGIFLTALTRPGILAGLVAAIAASRPDARILVRNHPVALLKSDFSELASRHKNLEITMGNPLDDEIAACDLVFCGNSGVALNVLRGGRPVAYFNALDGLNFDYIGFVESGLVYDVAGWSDGLYSRLKAFYDTLGWQAVMRRYDASYGTDKAQLERVAAHTIQRYLTARQGPD